MHMTQEAKSQWFQPAASKLLLKSILTRPTAFVHCKLKFYGWFILLEDTSFFKQGTATQASRTVS